MAVCFTIFQVMNYAFEAVSVKPPNQVETLMQRNPFHGAHPSHSAISAERLFTPNLRKMDLMYSWVVW